MRKLRHREARWPGQGFTGRWSGFEPKQFISGSMPLIPLYLGSPQGPHAHTCIGNLCYPKRQNQNTAIKSPNHAKQKSWYKLNSVKAHRCADPSHNCPFPNWSSPSPPAPPDTHAVAPVHGLLWAQPSASGSWELRGSDVSEIQARETSPSSRETLCRVHSAVVTGSGGRELVKMKVEGQRHGKREGTSPDAWQQPPGAG